MPESVQHQELVERIIHWIRTEKGAHSGLTILTDTMAVPETNRPARIDGYCPDVHARTLPSSFTILGEAKSFGDVFERHTELQVRAFLQYLSLQREPTFVFAVPLGAFGAARSLVKRVKAETSAKHVTTIFLYG